MEGLYTKGGFMDPETALQVLGATNPFYSDPALLGIPNPPEPNRLGITPDRYALEELTPKYAYDVLHGSMGTVGAIHRAYIMNQFLELAGRTKVKDAVGAFARKFGVRRPMVEVGHAPVSLAKVGGQITGATGYAGALVSGEKAAVAMKEELVRAKKGFAANLLEYLLPVRPGGGLFGAIRAGIKSFYGWNVLLGVDESATLSDYAASLTKHIAGAYAFRAASYMFNRGKTGILGLTASMVGRLGNDRVTGAFLGHLKRAGFGEALKELGLLKSATGRVTAEEIRRARQFFAGAGPTGKRDMIRFYRWSKSVAESQAAAQASAKTLVNAEKAATQRLEKKLMAAIQPGKLESKSLTEATGKYLSARAKVLRESFRSRAIETGGKFGLAETTELAAAKQAAQVAGRETRMFLASRIAQTIGFGMRIANIVAGASMAFTAVKAMREYQKESLREYINQAYGMDTTYSNFPQYQMDGTERQRAIQAIQESNLNIRNALGNEASFVH